MPATGRKLKVDLILVWLVQKYLDEGTNGHDARNAMTSYLLSCSTGNREFEHFARDAKRRMFEFILYHCKPN